MCNKDNEEADDFIMVNGDEFTYLTSSPIEDTKVSIFRNENLYDEISLYDVIERYIESCINKYPRDPEVTFWQNMARKS